MLKKRVAMEAVMPDIVKKTSDRSSGDFTGNLPNSSVIFHEHLPISSVSFTDLTRNHRNRPLQEKAVRKTYSFYPRTVRGLEKYADDNGMTYSQVINLALRQLIPRSYFEDD
ncbi:MAG: hypothetical protein K6T65_13255 [Peptococcaceae bacterium]|nr:hypothetical protein [Peptococcaceae bacterium]